VTGEEIAEALAIFRRVLATTPREPDQAGI
jgi:hypothetical protein